MITHQHYAQRRRRLTDAYPERAFVFLSGSEKVRNGTVMHPFRVHSDLLYLTGITETKTALVMATRDGVQHDILFIQDRDPLNEHWTGPMLGHAGATHLSGIQDVRPWSELFDALGELLLQSSSLGYQLGAAHSADDNLLEVLHTVRRKQRNNGGLMPIFDPRDGMGELRLRKSAEEIALMRRAAELSAKGHTCVMELAALGDSGLALAAIVEAEFLRGGAAGSAYNTVIAVGDESTCLHASPSLRQLVEGNVVLVDAGAEVEGYASDITRTFPAGKRFTEAQAALYDCVLEAQEAAIAAATVGSTLEKVHLAACAVLRGGLSGLGLGGELEQWFTHKTSHWIGLDTHDVGHHSPKGSPRTLEAGFCFTVEPGMYIPGNADDAPASLRGVGIRIEDTVLVTDAGPEVLTRHVPKTRAAVEALRNFHR